MKARITFAVSTLAILASGLATLAASASSALASPALASSVWSALKPLPTARGGLASVTFDGQVYVIGGATSDFAQSLNTVEAYNPRDNTWHTDNSAGLTPRVDLGVASADGRIYAIGGYDNNGNASAAVESFDPRDPAAGWRSEAPLPIVSPSGWAGAAGLAAAGENGLIYAVGGYDQDGDVLANLEIYNPRTNAWSAGPAMPTARAAVRATFAGGRLFVIGGTDSTGTIPFDTVEAYDPATRRWSEEAPIPTARWEPAVATLTDGQIVAAGGCCVASSLVGSGPRVALTDAEVYTPARNAWQPLPPLPEGRAGLAGASLGDDEFLAIGGFVPGANGPQAQSLVEALHITPNCFKK